MGVEIVKAVAGHPDTSRLSGNAFKVLVAMALMALDKPKDGRPAGLYFGGWVALQVTLGYDESDDRDSAAHAAVKRAVRELRDGNHISPMTTAARGHRQSYFVHPGGLDMGDTTVPQSPGERGTPSVPKRGTPSVPKRGTKTAPKGGHPASHLGHTEERRGLTKDKQINSSTQPQDAPDDDKRDTGGHRFKGRPGDECEECGRSGSDRRAHPLHLLLGTA